MWSNASARGYVWIYLDMFGYFLYFLNKIFFKEEEYPSTFKIMIWDKIFIPVTILLDFLSFYKFGKNISEDEFCKLAVNEIENKISNLFIKGKFKENGLITVKSVKDKLAFKQFLKK